MQLNIFGSEYSWGDVQVIIMGKSIPVNGIIAFEYGGKQDKTNIFGRGFKPVARGKGKIEYSGSLTILQSEFEAMVRAIIGEKDPLFIPPSNITVSYAPEGGIVTTDKLFGCEFTEWKKGMKVNDPNMEIVMPMMIGNIQLGQL
jgi:hypothetical protein